MVCGLSLIATFAVPHAERDDANAFRSFVQDDYGLIVLVGILSLVVVLTMTAGLVGLAAVLIRTRPALAVVGTAIMLAGFISYLVIVGTDNATAALARTAPASVVAQALGAANDTPCSTRRSCCS